MCELGKQDQMLKSSGICHLSNSRTRGVAMRPSMRCSGERSKEINTKIGQRYLTPVALEDPRVGPVFATVGDVTIGHTPHAWRSYDLKSLDDQPIADMTSMESGRQKARDVQPAGRSVAQDAGGTGHMLARRTAAML
jgi:hypothetical protein